MRKKLILINAIMLILFTFTACGCDHAYDEGVVTKEATCIEEGEKLFTCSKCNEQKTEKIPLVPHLYKDKITKEPTVKEEGEKVYTCENCGDYYTEVIPAKKVNIDVNVTDKKSLDAKYLSGKFTKSVEFTFEINNKMDKDIRGIQGSVTAYNLFGDEILTAVCNFTGNTIKANHSTIIDGMGINIYLNIGKYSELYSTDFEDMTFKYDIIDVVYDEDVNGQETEQEITDNSNVLVTVIDKKDMKADYFNLQFSPYVEFTFEVHNNTSKDIKGVQGTFIIKDMFGEKIMASDLDFTSQIIKANESVIFPEQGFDVYAWEDEKVKIYNTNLDDLEFEYEVTAIAYTDGTSE